MTEEMKKILFQLEIVARKHTIEVLDDGNIETMPASVVHELRLNNYSAKILLNYITNLQKENEELNRMCELYSKSLYNADLKRYKSRNEKAVEYITSYKSISTIQGLDNIEQNKTLDEKTMNIMTDRYLKVHHELLNILQGGDE